jgi:hypothetical protein
MRDHRHSRFVPERWVTPAAPLDARLRARFDALAASEQRAVVAAARDVSAARAAADPELVRALAGAEVQRTGRRLAGAVILGWLVLMTIWGIGRSGFEEQVSLFLVTGLAAGILAAGIAVRSVLHRRDRARAVIGATRPR